MKISDWSPLGIWRTRAARADLAKDSTRPAAQGHFAFHLPPIDPRRGLHWLADHHIVPKSWLVAKLLLMVGAGAAMIAAGRIFLGDDVRIADATAVAYLEVEPAPRGDRLPVLGLALMRDLKNPIASTIEQIDDHDIGVRRFIHLVAPLTAPEQQNAASAQKSAAPGSVSRPEPLPTEILFGTSRPQPLPDRARAYAPSTGDPVNLTVVAKADHGPGVMRRVVVARPGDRLERIVGLLGADDGDATQVAALLTPRGFFSSGALAGGDKIVVEFKADRSSLRPMRVSLYRGRRGEAAALAHDGKYVLVRTPPPELPPSTETLDAAAMPQSSALREGLYAVGRAAHIARDAVADVLKISEHDFDLGASASAGDKAELLYSPDEQGKPVVIFAAIQSGGRTGRYYRYLAPNSTTADYYDASGHTAPRIYLHKPVAEGRLGDGFGWRTHPVLGDRRFHEGVDFAAPMGSPIVGVADGIVEKIDRQWGYGKYIRIRHDSRFETTYAHIAGVAGGLKVGDRVRQGQTIAYVGSTGLSTGPHLYYEMRVDGRDVDPLRTDASLDRSLAGDALVEFNKVRARVDTLLTASMPSDGTH